ncbi:MAG: DUF134 domain-containing protein [Bacteroidales bacterium]|jgi:predicted DNA-binding protein (UPF0251 family)|nr:DUF134 domain-containing protein [Bacteroidales bacterium]
MSPRPCRLRKVSKPPLISGLKPYGDKLKKENVSSIFLFLEEYEAIRLCDHEIMNHKQAANMMDVSRPTLTRIYTAARRKIADALVNGRQIIIEGGKIYFDSEWYQCSNCCCYFNNPGKMDGIKECPLCRSSEFTNVQQPE